LNIKFKKSRRDLRKFALVMTIPLVIIAALLFWKERPAAPYIAGIAAFFILSGLAAPIILAPIERAWMAFANVLSIVMTYLILTLTFFLVITPMGLLLRLIRKDLLDLKKNDDRDSFWSEIEVDGPSTRIDKPF